ncbi:MAG: hypothetical protein KatS3mg064_1115 [Tepidiforma sp.]|nr:hypothetical protein [Tepidiforma sp.]GIW17958.1 MAG: hypothetical protein KatS3mg064_1115 [Tepidiforma sp.]
MSEYSDANSHPDWFFTIPFGSNSSITLLTAQTSDGWTWPTTGAGRDKATVRNDCLPKGTLIVGKVKDPSSGVPAADGSQFSGTATNQGNAAVINWGPITFSSFATLSNTPAGTYTLAETSTQNGWTPYGWASGSLNQQGQPTCPADKNSYTPGNPKTNVQVNANQTTVVCVMNTKTAQVPSIAKVKASEGYSGGYAYWEIKVENPSYWFFTVFKIEDSGVQFVSVSNGTCTGHWAGFRFLRRLHRVQGRRRQDDGREGEARRYAAVPGDDRQQLGHG